MFAGCSAFNTNLSSWNTSAVTDMNGMFQNATAFSSDLSSWNVSNVTNMSYMFAGTRVNFPISGWNTSKVTTMSGMFLEASLFNQNLASLNISAINDMTSMLYLSGMSQTNYHNLLIGWGTGGGRTTRSNVTFGISQEFLSTNSSAVVGRSYLQGRGWQIVDHGNETTTILNYNPSRPSAGLACVFGGILRFGTVDYSENRGNGVVLDINWGDGTGERVNVSSGSPSHTYSNTNTRQIRITFVSSSSGSYYQFGNGTSVPTVSLSYGIVDVVRFGSYMRLVDRGFYQFLNLNISATDQPLLPLNNRLDYCFYGTNLSTAPYLSSWDTTGIINMAGMFFGSYYDGDFRDWDFSSIVAGTNPSFQGLSFFISNLSTINYDSLIGHLATTCFNSGIYLGVGSTRYTGGGSVESAYTILDNNRSWTISDGGKV